MSERTNALIVVLALVFISPVLIGVFSKYRVPVWVQYAVPLAVVWVKILILQFFTGFKTALPVGGILSVIGLTFVAGWQGKRHQGTSPRSNETS
jgi:hypothetical protein